MASKKQPKGWPTREQILACVPHNWCDELLQSEHAVNCRAVELILNGIRARLDTLIPVARKGKRRTRPESCLNGPGCKQCAVITRHKAEMRRKTNG